MSSFTIPFKTGTSRSVALAAVLLNLGLAVGYLFIWLVAYQRDMFWRADFTAFYTGAKIVLSGEGSQLYNLDMQAQVQSESLEGYIEPGSLAMPYVNPPYLAVLLAPLAFLPRQVAYLAWTLGQLLLVMWYIRLLWKISESWSRTARWISLSVALAIPSMMLNLLLGSFSLIMLCCLLEFYLAIRNQRETLAGVWIAASALKPQNVVLEGIFLVACRRWKAVAGMLSTALILAAGSTALLGTRVWLDYARFLVSYSALTNEVSVDPSAMYNLKGALNLILGSRYASMINLVSYTALGTAMVITFWLWRSYYQHHKDRFHLFLAITSLLGLIFSPHLNPQDGLLLIFPTLMFYVYLKEHNQPATTLAVLVVISPLLFLLAEFVLGSRLHFRLPFIAMLGLLIWLIWVLAKGKPSTIQDGSLI